MSSRNSQSLFDTEGNRKYLTHNELSRFLAAAKGARPQVMTFCLVLAFTGARLSEVLSLTAQNIDPFTQCIVFRSLKKRGEIIYRAVPVPKSLLKTLFSHHNLEDGNNIPLWPWCRTTAWSYVSVVMNDAALFGVCATPRGLRHTFAVTAVQAGVALNMVQKWLGHADIETTAIYANAVGSEELKIAKRVWRSLL
ncbi:MULTISPECIES: tyrosine-type recombinase/integrase [Kordiimonas]|jgi:integrase|uniref:tyrosine-type recombinase/integrase n=1 Tax=Kordiimonas TaxID=288021 RepID=UPI00257A8D48|nr:tyrosine-type recombinase/integrase [Kordiimonas sp. UBA4487]